MCLADGLANVILFNYLCFTHATILWIFDTEAKGTNTQILMTFSLKKLAYIKNVQFVYG